ncbi:MAG: ABC transporter permease [Phycisphaerales bacterium]|jgi:ABC-2 type transport system permease protein|nr:ABC transporter permease [Phycisphaeraceae bacterium]
MILALAIKDLRLLSRDVTALFFTFAFPVIFAVFFGMMFSGGGRGSGKLALAIVDEDRSARSQALVQRLTDSGEFDLSPADSADAAEHLVLTRKAAAFIRIPAGFGKAGESFLLNPGNAPALEVGVDPSRQAESGMIQGILTKHAFADFGEAMMNPAKMRQQLATTIPLARVAAAAGAGPKSLPDFLTQLDRFMGEMERETAATTATPSDPASATTTAPAAGFNPVNITTRDVKPPRTGPTNAFAVSFPQGIIWGVMGASMGFAGSLLSERKAGTLARLLVAPANRRHVIMGKALGCLIACLLVILLMLSMAVAFFAVRPGDPLKLAAAILATSVAFVGLMMIVSCIARSDQGASGLGWGIMMVLAMLGGATVPLFAMPAWMQQVSDISPIKWAILAIEAGLWRPLSWTEVAPALVILTTIGVAGFAIGLRFFRTAP